ncbi:MAG TPA: flagellar export chaperone FlgN [Lachnospiraceae bacterium]|nr:flagellar export chaperone FlgN [Lachnospiraceae bacterium]HPF30063.1 flagellar export chaperone FlgN [Lachnospiraceae bacterium]
MTKQYMQMLVDGLKQKKEVLQELQKKTSRQTAIIADENADWEEFDQLVDLKSALIEKLTGLDDGFESVFARVKDDLDCHRSEYKEQIKLLQKLIAEVTELSTGLMACEEHNKELVTKKFAEEKDKIRQGRVSSKVATNYYKSMNRVNYIDPQLMDRKK